MTDKVLRRRVEDELDWATDVEAANIGVSVQDGVARLTGHVPSYAQKVAAGRAVTALKGVRALVDDLEVRPFVLADISDESIASRAADLLDWDVTLPKGAVKVTVHDGLVTLTGEVAWRRQRDNAERCVRHLHGIKGVGNNIAVRARASASDVQARIRAALDRQADLEGHRIEVQVDGDKVTLRGAVRAGFERGIIERAAWSAPGVRAVEDQLRVGP